MDFLPSLCRLHMLYHWMEIVQIMAFELKQIFEIEHSFLWNFRFFLDPLEFLSANFMWDWRNSALCLWMRVYLRVSRFTGQEFLHWRTDYLHTWEHKVKNPYWKNIIDWNLLTQKNMNRQKQWFNFSTLNYWRNRKSRKKCQNINWMGALHRKCMQIVSMQWTDLFEQMSSDLQCDIIHFENV